MPDRLNGLERELRVRLLGQVELTLDGEPFALATPRKSLQVLAYLLLHRAAPVSRDFLAFTLWPDEEEDVARSRLRSTLNDLLKVLPQPASDFVIVETDSLRWKPSVALWLDVESFEQAATDPQRLHEAVELYRGDLLPELYDEWISAERERRREAYLNVLLELGNDLRRRGKRARALEIVRKILAVDPWREDVVRRVMTIRYEMGDRAGALADYADFARRLHDDMGVEPMVETQGLAERLERAGDVEADENDETGAPSRRLPAADERFQFVGRVHEVERLTAAWHAARRRRGNVVLIGGDAGIGKSRLVAEFMRLVEDDGGRVLLGATGTPESFPYQSLIEALRSGLPLVCALELRPIWFATLASLIPELGQRLGPLPALPAVDAEQRALRLYEALSRTLTALAKPRPLLVVLEDLHWGSEATLDALAFLAQRVGGVQVLLVGTFRTDEAHARHPLRRVQRAVEHQGVATSLTLRPLEQDDVAAIVAGAAPERDAAGLYRLSSGNPLLLGQLLSSDPGAHDDAIAPTIASLVATRMQSLSEAARSVAEIAALAGQRFATDVVREVAGWTDADVATAVDELLERRIVREATGKGIYTYGFAHQLVQQAVADASDAQRRRDRSRRIGRATLRLYPERAQELALEVARHFEAGGLGPEAAEQYGIGARRALDLGAIDEARQAATRALDLDPESANVHELLLLRRSAHERLGDVDGENGDLDALEQLAERFTDVELQCEALMLRARLAVRRGDPAASAFLSRLRAKANEAGSALWAARADFAESQLIEVGLGLNRGVELLERALSGYRAAGDRDGVAATMGSLGRALVMRGDVAAGRALTDEAVALIDGSLSYETQRGIMRLATASAQDVGDVERAAALAPRYLDASVAAGDRREEVLALSAMAWALSMTPDFARALPLLDRAADICRDWSLLIDHAFTESNAGEIWLRLGAFERALPLLERTFVTFGRLKPLHVGGDATNLALALTYSGKADRAERVAHEALAIQEASYVFERAATLESLGEAQWQTGDLSTAIASLGAAVDLRRSGHAMAGSANGLALMAALRAQTGDLDAARAALTAFSVAEETFAPGALWPERTAWAVSFAHRRCGDPAAADRWLVKSLQLYDEFAGFLQGERLEQFAALPWHRAAAHAAAEGDDAAAVW